MTAQKRRFCILTVILTALLFSTGPSSLIVTSLAFPALDIYWSHRQLWVLCLVGATILAGVLALTSKKKKKFTMEDILFNVGMPLIVLMIIRCISMCPAVAAAAIVLAVLLILRRRACFDAELSEALTKRQRGRKLQLATRRATALILMILFVPCNWLVGKVEQAETVRTYYAIAADAELYESQEIEEKRLFVSEAEWEGLNVEQRMAEMKKITDYFCEQLGVEKVEITAVRQTDDALLAYYSDMCDRISYNVIYLNSCSLRDAIHEAAHEVQHRYQHAVIDSLNALDEAGFDYQGMEMYQEAIQLRAACRRYAIDAANSVTYQLNLMEVRAEQYAFAQEREMECMGYLTGSEEEEDMEGYRVEDRESRIAG